MFPAWSLFALGTAFLATAMPLLQERFKADAFALALWIKIFSIVFSIPLVLHYGLPGDWRFYLYVGLTAVFYSISDVIYFRAIPVIGSGLISRLIPTSVVITFFLWLAVDPSLLKQYADEPWKASMIVAILLFFVYSATHVKKCSVSWQGFRMIWFVIFAGCVGPVFSKLGMQHADHVQAPYAYIFVQAAFMTLFLGTTYLVKKPIAASVFWAPHSIRTGFAISTLMTLMTFTKMKAFQLVDNPGFASMVMFTDVLWILLVYKLINRKENGNIWAGLGIVASALLVVIVKNL